MSSSNLDAIRRRLAAATSTDWQRLDHYGEAQAEFTAHARADMATLLAALDAAEARIAAAIAVPMQQYTNWSAVYCRGCGWRDSVTKHREECIYADIIAALMEEATNE